MFFITKSFWTAAAERAVKSFGQGIATAFVADKAVDAFALDYVQLAGFGLGMAFFSVVTSLASAGVGEAGPSLAGEVLTDKVAATEAHPSAQAEYQAGPAAHVPEGTAVHVVPDVNYLERVEGAVQEALTQPYSGDTKAEAAHHDPLEAPNEDYDPRH